MKHKVLAAVVIFSLLVCSGNLAAKERQGAELVIQKLDGQQVRGELVVVKQNSLLLLESEKGADISIDIDEIEVITVVRGSKAGVGFLGGAVLGALFGVMLTNNISDKSFALIPIAGFAAIFALGGLLGGETAGRDYTYKFEGKSPEEVKNILKELYSHARISSSQ